MTDLRHNNPTSPGADGKRDVPPSAAEGESASLKPVDDGRNPPAGDLPHAVVDLSSSDPSSAPGMPHERDETVGMTGGIPSERIEQAHDDVTQGRKDTSRGIEADETYQKQKQP